MSPRFRFRRLNLPWLSIFRLTLSVLLLCIVNNVCSKNLKTDIVVLKNGNLINGEIKNLEYGVLTFKTDNISTLTIRWTEILKIKADGSFEVILQDKSIHLCSFDTTINIREVVLILDSNNKIIPLKDLVGIAQINKKFFDKLDGSLNLGLSYTKSSDVLQFNLSGSITYKTYHNEIYINGSSVITRQKISDSVDITRKQDVAIGYKRYFEKEWFFTLFTGLQQNTELGVNARILVGIGGGKDLFQTNLHTLTLTIAPLFSREYTSQDPQNSLEGAFLINYRIYKYTLPRVIFSPSVYTLPGLSDPGRIRMQADIDFSLEIISHFTITLSNYHSYDNRPIDETASKYDWGITASLGYTF